MKHTLIWSLGLAAALHAQTPDSTASAALNPNTDTQASTTPTSAQPAPTAETPASAQENQAVSNTRPSDHTPSAASTESKAPSPDKKNEAPVDSKPSTTASADSKGNLSIGSLSLSQIESEGLSATRISWRPEFSISKLGVALDLELLLRQGQISSEGWNFDEGQVLNTLFRKIYYIRWDQPGAKFYARVGALEGINLDAGGLITRNYGNSSLYPSSKPLGSHIQLNRLSPLGIDLEAFTNSWQDWNQKGGVLGARAALRPLAPTKLPLIKGLKLGVNFVKDFNQYAALKDSDRDGCPDDVDQAPKDASTCTVLIDQNKLLSSGVDSSTVHSIDSLLQKATRSNDNRLKGQYSQANAFGMIGFDARLPLIESSILNWEAYSALAFATEEDQLFKLDHMGVIPFGSSLNFGILHAKLENRWFQNKFKEGHFGADYDMQRTVLDSSGGKLALVPYGQREFSKEFGERLGFMGEAYLDLGNIATVGGQYSQMNPIHQDLPSDRSYELKASLGQQIVQWIPKLASAETFYRKEHIGLGINSKGESDSFFDLSSYTSWGYSVGVKASDNLIVNVINRVSYVPSGSGLRKIANFGMETSMQF